MTRRRRDSTRRVPSPDSPGVSRKTGVSVVDLTRDQSLRRPDSATLLIVREFVRTGHMYLGLHSPPYLVTLYGPLTYAFLSLPYRAAEAAATKNPHNGAG